METEAYYERLRTYYRAVPEQEPFELPIDQLAQILGCTRRNTQLILKRLTSEGYVEWISGRGRGNQSHIIFKVSSKELLFKRAQKLVVKENIQEAWELLGSMGDEPALRKEFSAWLTSQFGISTDHDEKDILRFPFYRPVLNLDPAYVHRRTEAHWIKQVLSTLVDYSQQEKCLRPQLAHYWEANETYTEWTFYLRKGVRFHNGKPLTPLDVVYTFNRILSKSTSNWMTSVIKDIHICGKRGIRFLLTEPNGIFPNLICTERYSIVPDGWRGEDATIPVGTGPFQIVKNTDSMLILEANEHYYEARPYLDRIEMWVWPNYEGEISAIESEKDIQLLYSEGQIDKGINPTLTQLEFGSVYLSFNRRKMGVLEDERIRRAIHLGLDRQRLIDELGGTRQQISSGFIPHLTEQIAKESSSIQTEQARKLIEESDYAGEILTLYTYQMRSNEENAFWVQEAFAKIGMKIQVVVLPIEQLSEPEMVREADMILAGEVLGEQPDITLIEMYRDSNGYIRNNLSFAQRRVVDKTISYCLSIVEENERMRILKEIQEELKGSFSLLFLHHNVQLVGHHKSLGGIAMNAWGKINYKDVWVHP